jgi:hypothetical protein
MSRRKRNLYFALSESHGMNHERTACSTERGAISSAAERLLGSHVVRISHVRVREVLNHCFLYFHICRSLPKASVNYSANAKESLPFTFQISLAIFAYN